MAGLIAKLVPLGIVALVAEAVAADISTPRDIQVCLNSDPSVRLLDLYLAKDISSRLLSSAGVSVRWVARLAPDAPDGAMPIVVDLIGDRPGDHPNVLAYAFPYEREHILVMLDRVEHAAGDQSLVPSLLAHVMAHEMAHVLEGLRRHSTAGIMKPNFSPPDYQTMRHGLLTFTPDDIELIQVGLRARLSQTCGSAPCSGSR